MSGINNGSATATVELYFLLAAIEYLRDSRKLWFKYFE
jgi:hypothetical protein